MLDCLENCYKSTYVNQLKLCNNNTKCVFLFTYVQYSFVGLYLLFLAIIIALLPLIMNIASICFLVSRCIEITFGAEGECRSLLRARLDRCRISEYWQLRSYAFCF